MNTDNTNDKRLKGIDVSHYQGAIDWKKVKEAGYQFAFLKASEGVELVDETFATNRTAAREAGLSVGYYHFFRPNASVDAQVTNFVRTVGRLETDALRPVLDCEDPRIWKNIPVKQRVDMIVDWCQKVKKALGVSPMLYVNPSFVDQMLENAPELSAYDLWIANWNGSEPTVPKPWTQWRFWQFSDKGTVPGIIGDVDLDWFNGEDIAKSRSKENDVTEEELPLYVKIFFGAICALYFIGLASVIWERFCN